MIIKQSSLTINIIMLKYKFKKQNKDAHVDTVIIYCPVFRHYSSSGRIEVSLNSYNIVLLRNIPELKVADTGGKTQNIQIIITIVSYLYYFFSFCPEHIFSEIVPVLFSCHQHYDKIIFFPFAYAIPQSSDIQ